MGKSTFMNIYGGVLMITEKSLEQRLRRQLKKHGYSLHKLRNPKNKWCKYYILDDSEEDSRELSDRDYLSLDGVISVSEYVRGV